MSKAATQIADLFKAPDRFLRSVQLERDFHDLAALDDYVLTPPMAEAFRRVAEGLRGGAGRRAWRVTGDYGVGKSSFALVLAHLVSDPTTARAARIADLIGWRSVAGSAPVIWPILLTGAREAMTPALARGIAEAVRRRKPTRGRTPKRQTELIELAQEVASSGSLLELEALIEALRAYAAAEGAGVLLVVDELGKFLEHAAQRPDREDVFVLQRLAELAARSADRPFLLLGLLHQGFQAYSERLPAASRHEWEKVASRFEEIVFDQPLAHTAALVAGALNLQPARLPSPVRNAARQAAAATAATGWLGGGATGAATLDAARLYPLHPTLLPVLVRFFARFGQHERSLFGFLLSSEPFALQWFAQRPIAADAWYGLAEFYDYVRASFGHRLAGDSYRSQWVRIQATIDGAQELDELALRVLKAVAVLNLLDAEDLLPTERAIHAAFSPARIQELDGALAQLTDRGLLFRRGIGGGLRLWPSSSVSLEGAFQLAARTIGPVETVAGALDPFLDHAPIMARRHYVREGTLRYFEVRYARAGALAEGLARTVEADGLLLIVLADTEDEYEEAARSAQNDLLERRPEVLVAIAPPLQGLAPELQEARCWQWVVENTPELADDGYAAAEASRQASAAKRSLGAKLQSVLGVRAGPVLGVEYFRHGERENARAGGVSSFISSICDELYTDAPRITNELLNRNVLSSAASAARMRLIEGLFEASDKPYLGIDPAKAPPERSMYLSVLKAGRIHVPTEDSWAVVEPTVDSDPLRLRPAFTRLIELIEGADGGRVPVAALLSELRNRPWGVRAGVAPLLLAILLRTRSHELAMYEQGTFLHRFGPTDFLRLTKSPALFEIQHCRIQGVRLEVFSALLAAFSPTSAKESDILDVVRPLCQFAAQLHDYTRRATGLSRAAEGVRDALLSAREPSTLLFQDLPEACGVGAFTPDAAVDRRRVERFVTSLHDAVGELRGAYPALLARITARVAEALREEVDEFDRVQLASRAARVSLAARDPRLRTFALRLRDPNLSDDHWAEALASYVVAKPPTKWLAADEARFAEEIGALADLFHKVEFAAFKNQDGPPAVDAIRLNLTRGDGIDRLGVVMPVQDNTMLAGLASVFRKHFPDDRTLRVQMLTRLLWAELEGEDEEARSTSKTNTVAKPMKNS